MSNSKLHTILIVDDTPFNIDLLAEVLGGEYKIMAATSGTEALDRADQNKPDLILLDIMMPGMNGYETCRRLKENRATREIPVIFVTALSDLGDKTQGYEVGAVDYITKPINIPSVQAKVKKYLKRMASLPDYRDIETDAHIKRPPHSSNKKLANQAIFSQVDEQHDTSSKVADNLPCLDLDRGLKNLDGNDPLYRKLLADFLRDYADAALKVKRSLAEDNYQEIHLIAHTIKGLAGNIAAFPLQTAASRLEKAAIAKNNSNLNELHTDFSNQLQRVLSAIKLLPVTSGDRKQPTEIMDVAQGSYRIMIVDDTPSNITIIANFIKSDFAIKAATNGPAALEIIQSDWRPDLILLDIVMPGMDGIELCKIIRADPNLKEIPVIFITANTDDEILVRAFEAGGKDYIRKPVNKVELTTRIKAIIDQKKLAETLRAEQKLTGALEMAGAVCHEMGQPLQSILTCAEIFMHESDPGDKQHDLAKMIAEQIKSMAEITKKLQKITSYSTKKYLGSTNIIDLDKSSSK